MGRRSPSAGHGREPKGAAVGRGCAVRAGSMTGFQRIDNLMTVLIEIKFPK